MKVEQLKRNITDDDTAGAGEPKVLMVVLDDLVPARVPDGEVLVVAPALNSRLRHWVSDDDTALRRARARLTAFVERLERRGSHAEGRVGDSDPLLAINDALATFRADEIVIAAGSRYSNRDAEQLAARAMKRFSLPTSHIAEPLPHAA